jgi:HSP20 family protein
MTSQITPWTPYEFDYPLNQIARIAGRLLDGDGGAWLPAIDVERGQSELTVRADLPGIQPDQVKIEVQNGVLTISGQQERQDDENERAYVRHERRYGSFMRAIPLPEGVDPSQITAKTSNGVMEITIPLPEKASQGPVTITPTAA